MTTTPARPRGPATGTTTNRGLILVVFAVLIGIMLLWQGGGSGQDVVAGEDVLTNQGTDAGGTGGDGATTTEAPPATVVPPAQLLVVIANGSGTTGVAKTRATQLQGLGYPNTTFVNAAGVVPTTAVYFVPGAEADSKAVAAVLGLPAASVAAIPTPAPVADMKDNKVLVVLGQDALNPAPAGATTTVAQ